MRTHYGPWQPCWISNQHQKHKSGRGPSSEHFWQVWLISVQRFQRRRFKCEKLTDGRRMLTHDKSSHGLWPGELKNLGRGSPFNVSYQNCSKKNIYVNDSQNLAFPTSHFVIELLPFDYLSNQKQ